MADKVFGKPAYTCDYGSFVELPYVRDFKYFNEETGTVTSDGAHVRSGYNSEPTYPKDAFKLATVGLLMADKPVMGMDPEFFVGHADKKEPAFHFLPDKQTTKTDWFWDGFQAETRIEPDACHALLVGGLQKQLSKLKLEHGLRILPGSVWRVPDDILQLAADPHVALGCDPSKNAYGMHGMCVENPRELKARFAGGHIHFGDRGHKYEEHYEYIIRCLDAFCGIPSVCLAAGYDVSIRRRFYGLAGEYRKPPHGLEWRTLSNFWVQDPKMMGLVLDLARWGYQCGQLGLRRLFIGDTYDIVRTINYSDVRHARELMAANKELYTAWARGVYGTAEPFWKAINEGSRKVLGTFAVLPNEAWSYKTEGKWFQVPMWGNLR